MKKTNYYVLALVIYAHTHAMNKIDPTHLITPEKFLAHVTCVEWNIRYENGKKMLQQCSPHELRTLWQHMVTHEKEGSVWVRTLLEILTQQGKPTPLLTTVKKICTDDDLSLNETAVDRIMYYLVQEHLLKNYDDRKRQPIVPDNIACECLELLIAKGVVMDCDTIFNLVQSDRTLLIELLLRNGAVNVNGISRKGIPLWHLARSQAMRNLLIKYGNTQINDVDECGRTVLHRYASTSDTFGPDADHLLVIGSNIDAQNGDGDTPLHIAVRRRNQETIAWLVIRGADCTIKNNAGEYALPIRAYRDLTKKVLIKGGAQ
jgi:Ankyrin repeats (3 copies)